MSATDLPVNRGLFYGGAWHRPSGGYKNTVNPATGEDLGQCADADAADINAAVTAAHAGFGEWRNTTPVERSRVLRTAAQRLRDHAETLGFLDAVNCGNPVRDMITDVAMGADTIDFFAGLATETKGDSVPLGPDLLNYSIREPYGVCARILAYNHPILFASTKIGAALAAGNSLILKPPTQAPLSAYRMMELLEDVFPAGVLNLITCGQVGSEALVSHPLVPRISLIGSVQTGRAVAEIASRRLKHVTLELGGKNACVVFPDADIEKAGAGAVAGMNLAICGQSCGSTSRLFIHESIHDEVVELVAAGMSALQPGHPTDPATQMGCLISMDHRARVESMVAGAVRSGARLVVGGTAPNHADFADGPYYLPTLLADVTPHMDIAQQEIFGPVLSVIRWKDEEELFAAVNSVEYGLTASIWSQDLSLAHRAARRIEAGFVWVNRTSAHFPGVSFGGFKQSGLGKEESLEELLSFTREKVVTVAL